MYKILLTIATLFCAILSTTSFANTLNIYEKPDSSSKIVTSIKNGEQLIQIFHTEKKDWIKVANPQNGDVGWVKTDELKGKVFITNINGSVNKQITVDTNKEKQPISYNIVQYSGTKELKPEEMKKFINDMEERNKKMEQSIQKMHDNMLKSTIDMMEKRCF